MEDSIEFLDQSYACLLALFVPMETLGKVLS